MSKKRNSPKEYLFVDGYNVINSWDDLKKKAQISFEEARNDLIEILAEYHHYSGIEIIVVFDAHKVKGNSGKVEEYKGIKIIFTKENETADQHIERTLDSIGRIKRVRVATSDWMEQQIILSRGGTRISAKELEVEIYNERNMVKRRRKSSNQRNNIHIGRLDETILKKLYNWNKSND